MPKWAVLEYSELSDEAKGRKYWDFKLPVDSGLVEGPHASHQLRKLCAEQLLQTGRALRDSIKGPGFLKVVVSIDDPAWFGSRVSVFQDREYHEGFFNRNDPEQTWVELPKSRSFLAEWGIQADVTERGLRETIRDEDSSFSYDGEIWFFTFE